MPRKSDFGTQGTQSGKSILLIGGGGHCKSCIDVIEQERRFAIAGIIDKAEKVGEKVLGYPFCSSICFCLSGCGGNRAFGC